MGNVSPTIPLPSKDIFDVMELGPTVGSADSRMISSSHMYCLAQHVLDWPDYYLIVDLRSRQSYERCHINAAVSFRRIKESLPEHVQGMIVAIYDSRPDSANIQEFLCRVDRESVAAASIYILSEKFSEFRSKYFFILSDFKPTKGQYPGPLELIPRTKTHPSVYSLQRDRYPMCKTLVAYLGCSNVLNLSSTRLSVSCDRVSLENHTFDADNEPYEAAMTAFFKHAETKVSSTSWKGNILIIDEPGCSFSALLTGWYLVEVCGKDVEAVCRHMSNKCADLDPWYMNTLRHWAASRQSSVKF